MSERNTGLFLPGHVAPHLVARAFMGLTKVAPSEFLGEEAPRVGHGLREGREYTHVGLRFFEVAGLLLMDRDAIPAEDEVEMELGASLSREAGLAVYLFYDEENAAGGAATFRDGRLVDRECWDARELQPMHRHMMGASPANDLDTSDWIWLPASEAVARTAEPVVGPGVRTDDEICELIEAAAAEPLDLSQARRAEPRGAAPPPAPRPRAEAGSRGASETSGGGSSGSRRGGRLRGLLRKLRSD